MTAITSKLERTSPVTEDRVVNEDRQFLLVIPWADAAFHTAHSLLAWVSARTEADAVFACDELMEHDPAAVLRLTGAVPPDAHASGPESNGIWIGQAVALACRVPDGVPRLPTRNHAQEGRIAKSASSEPDVNPGIRFAVAIPWRRKADVDEAPVLTVGTVAASSEEEVHRMLDELWRDPLALIEVVMLGNDFRSQLAGVADPLGKTGLLVGDPWVIRPGDKGDLGLDAALARSRRANGGPLGTSPTEKRES